jgi:uncharacterized protein YcgL (UPF0745 family)
MLFREKKFEIEKIIYFLILNSFYLQIKPQTEELFGVTVDPKVR